MFRRTLGNGYAPFMPAKKVMVKKALKRAYAPAVAAPKAKFMPKRAPRNGYAPFMPVHK